MGTSSVANIELTPPLTPVLPNPDPGPNPKPPDSLYPLSRSHALFPLVTARGRGGGHREGHVGVAGAEHVVCWVG
jgi:hypothetical protein